MDFPGARIQEWKCVHPRFPRIQHFLLGDSECAPFAESED